ncbi:metallophosphoesterase [archaeon]|nr:metallophosphoesterase [archaeon]
MSLLQPLFSGKLDIIGDVHGELEALVNIVKSLGYDKDGNHPDNRKLVFVGDLVDRGPDSPGVVWFVKNLIDKGNAQMVLGNHEINVLQHKAKEGSGWYFESQAHKDKSYNPFKTASEKEKVEIFSFLSGLPIALENDELRVIHAAWLPEKIEEIKKIPLGNGGRAFISFEKIINEDIKVSGLLENYHLEQEEWSEEIEDKYAELKFLDYTCSYNLAHQMNNPLRALTAGVEKRADNMFFASGKWRFVQRENWWNSYADEKPVVIGHFWRKINQPKVITDENVFFGINPNEWHGLKNNVFCVDFSVGARFLEREKDNNIGENTHLVALRWPERELCFEDGSCLKTIISESKENSVLGAKKLKR